MSKIFGGGVSKASRESQAAQQAQNTATQQFIEARAQQAREDVLNLFPQADVARTAGLQGALETLRGGLDPQLAALQQGSVGAQESLISGLPQFQAAILGQPLNFSAFQPRQVNVDTSFLAQQSVPLPPQQEVPNQNVGVVDNTMPGIGDLQGLLGDLGRFGVRF